MSHSRERCVNRVKVLGCFPHRQRKDDIEQRLTETSVFDVRYGRVGREKPEKFDRESESPPLVPVLCYTP